MSFEGPSAQPEERFPHELAIFLRAAEKYGVSLEEARRDFSKDEQRNNLAHQAHLEAWEEVCPSDAEETEEYQQWRKEAEKLMRRAGDLLEEFYRGREVPPGLRLEISEGDESV